MTSQLIIVGSEKGGVGKSTVARALVDFFKKNCRVIDTEDRVPGGVIKRFHDKQTELINISDTDGQMQLFDALKNVPITIVDAKAGMLIPLLETMDTIGFLDKARSGHIRLTILHVTDGSVASVSEIQRAHDAARSAAKYVVVRCHINDKQFLNWPANVPGTVIDVPKLAERASETVDASNLPFSDFESSDSQSETLRGYVQSWRSRVNSAFDAASLGA